MSNQQRPQPQYYQQQQPQRPANQQQRPVSSQQRPVSNQQRPVSSQQRPVNNQQQRPVNQQQQQQRPVNNQQQQQRPQRSTHAQQQQPQRSAQQHHHHQQHAPKPAAANRVPPPPPSNIVNQEKKKGLIRAATEKELYASNASLQRGLSEEIAVKHSKAYKFLDPETGKAVSLLEERPKKLLGLGQAPVLYLTFHKLTFCFLFILMLIHVPQVYVYYTGTNYLSPFNNTLGVDGFNNIYNIVNAIEGPVYRSSMGNWDMKTLSVVPAFCEVVIVVYILVFLRLMKWLLSRMHLNFATNVVTAATYTIYVQGLPRDEVSHGNARLKEYFSQFGEIVNVAMILNSGNVQKLKEEYKRARLKRIKAETHAHATKGYSCCCVPFVHSLQQRWYSSSEQALKKEIDFFLKRTVYECTGDAFVTFKTEESRYKCLRAFNRPAVCGLCASQSPKYHGKRLLITNAKTPRDILWENFEFKRFTKTLRRSVAAIVSVVAIALSVVLAFVLQTLRQKLNIETRYQTLASVAISLGIYIVTTVTTFILYHVSNFERHRFENRRRRSLMYKLVFSTLFLQLTSLAVYIVRVRELNSVLTGNIEILREQSSFYYSIMSFLVIDAIALSIKDGLMVFVHMLIRRYKAMDSVTQIELNEAFVPPVFSLEYRYAYQLKHICLGLIVSALWPPALLILCVSLPCSYMVDKFNLFRVYQKFDQSTDLLNRGAMKVLLIACILRYVCVILIRVLPAYISLNFNFYTITVAFCGLVVVVIFAWEYILPNLNCFKRCCNVNTEYMYPNYLTKKGQVPIDTFKGMELYVPPVLPTEVANPFEDDE